MQHNLRWLLKLYLVNHIIPALPSNRARIELYRRVCRMTVGSDVCLDQGLRLYGWEGITIGYGTVINWGTVLDGRGGLVIGDCVNVSPEVAIYTAYHDATSPTFAGLTAPVQLGNHVWLASRALVLPGVSVGEGAIVGAGAVVTKDIEPYAIIAGNPARPIGRRTEGLDYVPRW